MHKLKIFTSLLVLAACNSGSEKSAAEMTTDTVRVKTQVIRETTQEAYFNGYGADGSFTMSLSSSTDGSFEMTITGQEGGPIVERLQRELPAAEGKTKPEPGESVFSNGRVSLSIKSGICNDRSGNQHSHTFIFKSEDKTLEGCGDYVR